MVKNDTLGNKNENKKKRRNYQDLEKKIDRNDRPSTHADIDI